MISFTYFSVFVFCLAFAAGVEEEEEKGTTSAPADEDVAHRELTDTGYVIRNGGEVYRYPMIIHPLIRQERPLERNPIETNQIQTNEIENEEEDRRRPLFYFTYEGPNSPRPLSSRPYLEIRKKRSLEESEVAESSKVGKLRRKRTYCRKCGGGGGGGYYVPVSYAVYPVYYGGGGGGGRGCNTCGGGYGGGYGGGGSYSYSSSSAQSSAGSFGWGKK